jgi:hypothetical protein
MDRTTGGFQREKTPGQAVATAQKLPAYRICFQSLDG